MDRVPAILRGLRRDATICCLPMSLLEGIARRVAEEIRKAEVAEQQEQPKS